MIDRFGFSVNFKILDLIRPGKLVSRLCNCNLGEFCSLSPQAFEGGGKVYPLCFDIWGVSSFCKRIVLVQACWICATLSALLDRAVRRSGIGTYLGVSSGKGNGVEAIEPIKMAT